MYYLRLLSREENKKLLDDYILRDFGDEEVLPNLLTKELDERGLLKSIGLFQEQELVTYGLFHTVEPHNRTLLGYFATLQAYRKQGMGTKFFTLLHRAFESGRMYLGQHNECLSFHEDHLSADNNEEIDVEIEPNMERIFIEVDDPEFAANEHEFKIRQNRMHFYQQNGFVSTPLVSHILHSKFRIMICDYKKLSTEPQSIQRELLSIYRTLYADHFLSDHVNVTIDGRED